MISEPMTVNEWLTLMTLCEEEAERLAKNGPTYTARQIHGLAMKCRARLDALREGRVVP